MTRRPILPMPEDVRVALDTHEVSEDYQNRPHYQRNDYLGWIAQAKHPETRQKRIDQMIAELKRGGVYMGMRHTPSEKR
jgi:uncharacterized protein YdeI (YjbR/CyaY-like superfamily)